MCERRGGPQLARSPRLGSRHTAAFHRPVGRPRHVAKSVATSLRLHRFDNPTETLFCSPGRPGEPPKPAQEGRNRLPEPSEALDVRGAKWPSRRCMATLLMATSREPDDNSTPAFDITSNGGPPGGDRTPSDLVFTVEILPRARMRKHASPGRGIRPYQIELRRSPAAPAQPALKFHLASNSGVLFLRGLRPQP